MLDVDGKISKSIKLEVDLNLLGSFMRLEDNKLVIDDLNSPKVISGFYKIKVSLINDEKEEILHQYVQVYIKSTRTKPIEEEPLA